MGYTLFNFYKHIKTFTSIYNYKNYDIDLINDFDKNWFFVRKTITDLTVYYRSYKYIAIEAKISPTHSFLFSFIISLIFYWFNKNFINPVKRFVDISWLESFKGDEPTVWNNYEIKVKKILSLVYLDKSETMVYSITNVFFKLKFIGYIIKNRFY